MIILLIDKNKRGGKTSKQMSNIHMLKTTIHINTQKNKVTARPVVLDLRRKHFKAVTLRQKRAASPPLQTPWLSSAEVSGDTKNGNHNLVFYTLFIFVGVFREFDIVLLQCYFLNSKQHRTSGDGQFPEK